jgi:CBS-domain-containing membrane protein
LAHVSARETMSFPVFSSFGDEDLEAALKTMATHHVRRLPVITRTGHLEGVLSIDDIVEVAGMPGTPAAAEGVTALRAINAHRSIRAAHA